MAPLTGCTMPGDVWTECEELDQALELSTGLAVIVQQCLTWYQHVCILICQYSWCLSFSLYLNNGNNYNHLPSISCAELDLSAWQMYCAYLCATELLKLQQRRLFISQLLLDRWIGGSESSYCSINLQLISWSSAPCLTDSPFACCDLKSPFVSNAVMVFVYFLHTWFCAWLLTTLLIHSTDKCVPVTYSESRRGFVYLYTVHSKLPFFPNNNGSAILSTSD